MPTKTAPKALPERESDDHGATRIVLDRLAKTLADAATEVAWTQWSALGSTAASKQRARSTIDPEALILLSLFLGERERRLRDITHDWVAVASNLLSTQRIKNLASAYPNTVQPQLVLLAQTAVGRAKDSRWKTLAQPSDDGAATAESGARTNKVRAARPSLIEPAALLLRLRQAFGVGIKADTLGFLLGTEDAWATAREISAATGYTIPAVRRAVDEMAAARVIMSADDTATLYRADAVAWGALLNIRKMPTWRSWQQRFVFVAAFLQWTDYTAGRRLPAYAVSVQGREIFETHRIAFERNRVVPWPTPALPGDWPALAKRGVTVLAEWMQQEV